MHGRELYQQYFHQPLYGALDLCAVPYINFIVRAPVEIAAGMLISAQRDSTFRLFLIGCKYWRKASVWDLGSFGSIRFTSHANSTIGNYQTFFLASHQRFWIKSSMAAYSIQPLLM
jgi:hypothetical protein